MYAKHCRNKGIHFPQIYTYVSSDEDKAARKEFRHKLEVIVELAMHTLAWKEKGFPWLGSKAAFNSMLPTSEHMLRYNLRGVLQRIKDGYSIECVDVTPILDCADIAYNNYVTEPSINSFRKNYMGWLVRMAGIDSQSSKKMYPMFPDADSIPKRFFLL